MSTYFVALFIMFEFPT